MKYFIKGDYYFDIDKNNQLRITGTDNHLLLGIAFPETRINVKKYDLKEERLAIKIELSTNYLKTNIPIVTDIRTLRNYTEGHGKPPTFLELTGIDDLSPENIETKNDNLTLTFTSSYIDDKGQKNQYGAEIEFTKGTKVEVSSGAFTIKSNHNIKFTVRTVNNIFSKEKFSLNIFLKETQLPVNLLSPYLIDLFEEAGEQISYLIRTKRTSSFEYGTIFPRDWIESADLGAGDLSEEAIDYMYQESMKFVSERGEGWHEVIIGHYENRLKQKSGGLLDLIDRKMVDIEPHYILGMERLSKNFLSSEKNREVMLRVAHFVIEQATQKSLITFKKIREEGEEYYGVGNWRDSVMAFPNARSPIAPYDINCVFYPESLRIIKKYSQFFRLSKKAQEEVDLLIEKWSKNKDKYKLYHDEHLLGYSLAIHGKKHVPLPTPHLDESYDLFYSWPSMEEIVSFAKKIVDPDFFYTPVGPILVSNDEEKLSSENYHGKVIWPKQAAFAVAGLYKHYQIGLNAGWPDNILEIIRRAILTTCRACFKGWIDLGAVPELYYYDEKYDKARFYTDQDEYEGQMSLIQLWSSVGMRTITRIYVSMLG